MSAPGTHRGKTSDEEILSILANAAWPLGSTEVADAVGVTQQAAYNRLSTLADEGRVERKTTGGTVLWRPA
jgi:DNA-binding IclR family transcriptional regulator